MSTVTATYTSTDSVTSLTGTGNVQFDVVPFIGATTFAPGYSAANGDEYAAAGIYNGFVGNGTAYLRQKRYLGEGGPYPTTVPATWAKLQAAGCKFSLCVKLLRTGVGNPSIAASEIAKVQAVIDLLQPAEVIAWNEFNNVDASGAPLFNINGGNPAQPTYGAWCETFVPGIAATGVPVAVDVDISNIVAAVQGLLQVGPGVFVRGYADFYGNHNNTGQTPWKAPAGQSLSVFGVFDSWKIPPGLGEWGMASGTTILTLAQWQAYCQAIIAEYQARVAAGLPIGDIMYYSGQTSGGPNNVTGPNDMKVAGIKAVSALGYALAA